MNGEARDLGRGPQKGVNEVNRGNEIGYSPMNTEAQSLMGFGPQVEGSIAELVPRFLLADRNGYAMAYAIDAAIQPFLTTLNGMETLLSNAAEMPEWALDEQAWETATPWYDYGAGITMKRAWIGEAEKISGMIGTRGALKRLLQGIWQRTEIEEYWEYGASPFRFRVTVYGDYDAGNAEWTRNVIQRVCPLRCALDDCAVGADETVRIKERVDFAIFDYPICGVTVCGSILL